MPAAIIVASCRLNTAMSAAEGLPPPPNSLLPCVLTRVAATPWRRRSARSAASFTARDLPRTLLPRLSLPSQRNWVSFLLAVADTAINRSFLLLDGDVVNFFQAGNAIAHLFKAGTAQIPDPILR